LHITADDLHGFGIVDTIIPEPGEGAHTDHETAAQIVDKHIKNALAAAKTGTLDERMNRRYDKLRQLGKWGNS
jgi:acetyl-CoA carboxylase carboxyl transferase subunit alpha